MHPLEIEDAIQREGLEIQLPCGRARCWLYVTLASLIVVLVLLLVTIALIPGVFSKAMDSEVVPRVSGYASFTVMSWNLLADGLSDDGFVVPLRDKGDLKKVSGNEWDEVVRAVDLEAGSSPEQSHGQALLSYLWLTESPTVRWLSAQEYETGTMAEFVADQDTFKRLLLDPVADHAAECYQEGCQDLILGAFGKVTKQVVDSRGSTLKSDDEEELKKEALRGCSKCQPIVDAVFQCKEQISAAVMLLDLKWGLRAFREALAATLAWAADGEASGKRKGRGQRLVDRICTRAGGSVKGCPDIVATQENDHYLFFQQELGALGYRTTVGEGEQPMHDQAVDCSSSSSQEQQEGQQDHQTCVRDRMQDMTFARITKFGSKAQKLNKASGDPDNDGVALFWKQDRFRAVYISKKYFNEQKPSDGGVVGVLLEDKLSAVSGDAVCVFAMTTHLASGNKQRHEDARIAQTQTIATWLNEEIASGVQVAMQTANCRGPGVVLLMDGNSYQHFAAEKTEEHNMYNSVIRDKMHLTNFELDQTGSDEWENPHDKYTVDGRNDLPRNIAYSVNKIRGIASAQLAKIGQYVLDRIDYVCVSEHFLSPSVSVSKLSAPLSEGGLPLADRSAERDGKRSPYSAILPNYDNPSDHLPIVAELTFKSMTGKL